MRLGYNLGYWRQGPPPGALEAVLEAERLGFESIWTAEAYGSDAFTPLAWWGSRTERVKLGTAIAQLSARTPSATAMAAMTLDHLSGGRAILGIGASGPQVVEGWYGQPYPKPLARTREYLRILRDVMAREAPVAFEGEFYQLPYRGDGSSGLGKPLTSTVHPLRRSVPIYLAAEGPKNVELSAELADGWLPFLFSPRENTFYADRLAAGFAKRDARAMPIDDFEVAASVPLVIDDDIERAADSLRPMFALYIGGMGAKGANFHRNVIDRLGYAQEADVIQEHFLAGRKADAVAAVPTRMVEEIALIGPVEKIRDDLAAWEESVVTTLLVGGDIRAVRAAAELLG
jgi:F420-dependent oxidoreductase-like protein